MIGRTVRIILLSAVFTAAAATLLAAQGLEYIQTNYTKHEYEIAMRDGKKLHTAVYAPKDASRSYPIMLERTPYGVSPYGPDRLPARLGPSELFAREGFIFAYQDVRGRYMSEGEWEEVRPYQPTKHRPDDVDESTDTWDTIDWLVKNVPNNNGKVGMWGISYPGFYVTAGMIDAHPALKAASPQSPVTDYYMGDDSYHNGAFMLAANFTFYLSFAERKGGPAPSANSSRINLGTPDGYDLLLRMGSLENSNTLYYHNENPYWNMNFEHTMYDSFWQARSIAQFLKKVGPAVLAVGGWFDAEDLAGPLNVFRTIEKNAAQPDNHIVMGPWSHGGYSRGDGDRLGNLYFVEKTGAFYRESIEFPFFMSRLKGAGDAPLPKAYVFETGSNRWRKEDVWPPHDATPVSFYLSASGKLSPGADANAAKSFDEYLSDPNKPVPYIGSIAMGMTSDYMTEDQRFAAERPDVLVYQTDALTEDMTVAGPVTVRLNVSTTGTDSDFVVKLIDVYPGNYTNPMPPPQPAGGAGGTQAQRPAQNAVRMGGYLQLVRGEPFRGKFRNSFAKPEPFVPGKVATIQYVMPDICHTFKKGHRIMVQVQSSWFPLIDRNPQKFVEIPKAKPSDFQKATERVYHSSAVSLLVEKRK
jgi:putative CocE/NonD family hydrolase